jgi:glycerophosphoryl diester phosphodiesterase
MKPSRSILLRALVVAGALLAVVALAATAHQKPDRKGPLVIGHRGAAGYLPDHTLEGYRLAIKLGADYIEPDLVSTKDGHLIARHEPNISDTTDVRNHPEFADRKRTAVIDGETQEGWFASDFTLKEIKTLHAVQPLAERPQQFNGRFQIPTFEEVIALAKRESAKRHRQIGIYPETKHPTYHQQLGLGLERPLLRALSKAGWNKRSAPVFIQSFEQSNLKWLSRHTSVRLVQLVDAWDVNPDGTLAYVAPLNRPYDWTISGDPVLQARTFGFFATDAGLAEIATYADVISPWKRYIVSAKARKLNPDGSAADANGDGVVDESDWTLLPPTDLIARAHAHGLDVHTWTFRNEQRRLPVDYGGNPVNEYLQFYNLGIDGVFSDFADTAVASRELFRLGG